jgi:hypothetical protein
MQTVSRQTILVPTPGAPSKPESDDQPSSAPERLRWSFTASLLLALAIGVLVAVRLVGAGDESEVESFDYGIVLTILVLVVTLFASFRPGGWTREGLFCLWNALGLSIGVFAIGMLARSSMLALPPVLIGAALTAWPRWPDQPFLPFNDRVVLIGGICVLPLLALVQWISGKF